MRLRFTYLSRFWSILSFMLALSCGSHADDPTDGGAGAASGGTSNTGGSAGSGTSGGNGGTGGSGGSASGNAGTGGTGTGGTSGTGGAGGTGGTSGAGGTGGVITGDGGTCGCVTGHIGWGMDGGLVRYRDSSALEVCNLFVHQRMPVTPSPPALSCQQPMTDCAGAIGPGDVTRAVANADVRAAIAAAPVLYGEDPRPVDGQVLRIQLGTAIVEVGGPCRTAGCKPIPAGVDALATLLQTLTKQELSRPPCSTTFPPLP